MKFCILSLFLFSLFPAYLLTPYNARVRAWALVRLGMIHDAQKERSLAEENYQKALKAGADSLAQHAARGYLATPYNPEKNKVASKKGKESDK